jgi:hypothetical protein
MFMIKRGKNVLGTMLGFRNDPDLAKIKSTARARFGSGVAVERVL